MVKVYGETQDGKKVWVEVEKPILRVGVYGILLKGKALLLIKTYMPLWEFPGGAVESGETLIQALKREFKEETKIDIKVKKFILERESFYLSPTGKIFHSFQNFFLVEPVYKKSNPRAKVHWIPLNKLSEKNMKKSAYDALVSFLKKEKRGYFQTVANPK